MKIVADSEIAQTIDVTETEEYRRRYDAAAKKLVSQKAILAYILKSTMEEFQDVSVKQIAEKLIAGTPEVGTIAVHQDTPDAPKAANGSDASNAPDGYGDPPGGSDMADAAPAGQEQNKQKRLSGSDRVPAVSAEDTSIREGTVRYDIHFRVCVPGTERESVEIIMNVEVQNSDLPGYPIPKRAVYYVARLISAQRGEYREEEKNYDLMRFFVLRLGDPGEESDEPAVRLLSVLLSTEMTAEEKKKILSEEFYIDMTEELDQEVSSMCNLSEGILEKGIQAGIVRGRAEGRAEGMEAGIAKGRSEGRAEGIEAGKLEAAKNLLASGFDEETVITSLKLSADQIKALKES